MDTADFNKRVVAGRYATTPPAGGPFPLNPHSCPTDGGPPQGPQVGWSTSTTVPGEVEAVHAGEVAKLPAGGVAGARTFDFQHVRAEPGEELGAGGSRLHVRHIEDAHAFERGLRRDAR